MFWKKKKKEQAPAQTRRGLNDTPFDESCKAIMSLGARGAYGYFKTITNYANERGIKHNSMKLVAAGAMLYDFVLREVITNEMKNNGNGNFVAEFTQDMAAVQMHEVIARCTADHVNVKYDEDTFVGVASIFNMMGQLTGDAHKAMYSLLNEIFTAASQDDLAMIVDITKGCVTAMTEFYEGLVKGVRVTREGKDVVLHFIDNPHLKF